MRLLERDRPVIHTHYHYHCPPHVPQIDPEKLRTTLATQFKEPFESMVEKEAPYWEHLKGKEEA